MPTYVLMTKLSSAQVNDPRGQRTAGHEWLEKVKDLCPDLAWKAHYALLGPYDFMDLYVAPDQNAAFKVSLLSRELGAVAAESWPATTYEEYLPLADAVEKP